MVISVLHIRFQQVARIIQSVNWIYRLFILSMILLTASGIFVKSSQIESAPIALCIYGLSIVSLHWFRSDFHFLKSQIAKYKIVCFVEYFILSVPMCLGLIQGGQLLFVLIYIVGLILISFLISPSQTKSKKAVALRFIPNPYYEWISGLRKYRLLIGFLWLSGILFSFQMGVSITAIFIIGLFLIGFFDYCEPIEILQSRELNAKSFMLERFKGLLLMSGYLFGPILLSFLLFHHDLWYIPIIEITLLISYLGYALVLKYAFYEPNSFPSQNKVLLSLGALVLVIPFLLPATWILSIKLYFQSINKLKFYLDDYN